MDEQISQSLLSIAREVGKEWRRLGLLLGINWSRLDALAIETRQDSLDQTVFKVLCEWHDTNQPKYKTEDEMLIDLRFARNVNAMDTEADIDDEIFYYSVAERLGQKWIQLGTILGVDRGIIEHIKKDHEGNSADAAMEMLHKWRSHMKGTVHQKVCDLVQGLIEAQLPDLARNVTRALSRSFRQESVTETMSLKPHEIKFLLAAKAPRAVKGSFDQTSLFCHVRHKTVKVKGLPATVQNVKVFLYEELRQMKTTNLTCFSLNACKLLQHSETRKFLVSEFRKANATVVYEVSESKAYVGVYAKTNAELSCACDIMKRNIHTFRRTGLCQQTVHINSWKELLKQLITTMEFKGLLQLEQKTLYGLVTVDFACTSSISKAVKDRFNRITDQFKAIDPHCFNCEQSNYNDRSAGWMSVDPSDEDDELHLI